MYVWWIHMFMALRTYQYTFYGFNVVYSRNTNNAWQVSKPEIPTKRRKKLPCVHETQIREDKSAEQKAKPSTIILC